MAAHAQNKPKLTPQEMRFAVAYAELGEGKAAAIAAGWSEGSAPATSTRLLQKPHVKKAIEDLIDAYAAKAGVTGERVVREFADLAFFDVRDVVTVQGMQVKIKDSKAWSRTAAAAVAEVSQGPDGIKIKFHSKAQALTKLAEYLDLFKARDERNAAAVANILAAVQGTPMRPTTDA